MKNLKKKVSLILSIMMLALAVFPVTLSVASSDRPSEITMSVKMNGKELEDNGSYNVTGGEKVYVKAEAKAGIEKVGYYWVENGKLYADLIDTFAGEVEITIPTAPNGTVRTLYIDGVNKANTGVKDNTNRTGWQAYKMVWPAEEVDGDVDALYNGKVLSNGAEITVNVGEKIRFEATPSNRIAFIYFQWDKEDMMEVESYYYNLTIPDTFLPGSTHTLHLAAEYDNGELTEKKKYTIVIPDVVEYDDELEVLPWEKESKDLDDLAISLRNDSESEKANKNVYALNELVTYYVDFKNGGRDITSEVEIVLELPLDFVIVDSDNGKVDSEERTITWTYPEGMEEEYEGTKVVQVKYIGFDKKRTDSETVYPTATILKKAKEMDTSTVINYVYIDEETVITDTHEPYMFGDANATTFRPDDTITRAEGALVLTRILLGQNAIDNVKITSVFPDLNETYLEAQKAIVAATSYGIINGYTDGYYRPNQKMTRAEFMKILARYIELNAEDNDIKGLEIKDLDAAVKMYKNPVLRYTVNGTTVTNHWAIEEVSLLMRLNMTSVSAKAKDLRIDEEISRAEVAQLVNFFLLRAPADVTSKTKSQFSDVNKKHELFSDIIEATREAHDYTITLDGTEIAE